MKTKYKNYSRRRTPWDEKEELSPIEEFIRDKYLDTYGYKHPILEETNEGVLLNTYELGACRCCNSNRIRKHGFTKNGVQRYYCTQCSRTFNILTNTLFEDHKISIGEWIEFSLNLFRYVSLNSVSKNNKNSYSTSKYWLKKLFLVVESLQRRIVLEGKVQIDETYFPVVKRERIIINGKQLRGLSNDQYCIAVGCDEYQVYATVEGKGKTSKKKTLLAFGEHIKPGSMLIHDKEKSHSILVDLLQLSETVYDANKIKKLPNNDNPLFAVNEKCALLKRFLRAHSGFNRNSLEDYVNLFCFIQNPPYEKLEKTKILLNCALHLPKSLKYRDFYRKK